jgi:hypothetical protein
MKLMLLVLSCVIAVPLSSFAQANKTTVVAPPPSASDAAGAAIGMVTAISGETITVKTEAANPVSFARNKAVQFTDKKGRKIKPERVKAGARVRVYYQGGEDTRTATRVVLEG